MLDDTLGRLSSGWRDFQPQNHLISGTIAVYVTYHVVRSIVAVIQRRIVIRERVALAKKAALPPALQALITKLDESPSRARASDASGLVALQDSVRLPITVVDLDAFDSNVATMVSAVMNSVQNHGGGYALQKSIRVATKSVRCPDLILRMLDAIPRGRCAGLMTFTAAETLSLLSCARIVAALVDHRQASVKAADLKRSAHTSLLLAYPVGDLQSAVTVWRAHAAAVAKGITVGVMVDSEAHVTLLQQAFDAVRDEVQGLTEPLAIWIDLDMSLRMVSDRVHLGVRRSGVRTDNAIANLTKHLLQTAICDDGHASIGGLMGYEAQVAGLGDYDATRSGWLGTWIQSAESCIRSAVKRSSEDDGRVRRAEAFAALSNAHSVACISKHMTSETAGPTPDRKLKLQCNGGGSGSLFSTARDPNVSEITIGSGALCGHLFDAYLDRNMTPQYKPAIYTLLRVTRTPAANIGTCLGGGWSASGEAGSSRLPLLVSPSDARYIIAEGAGEVQTPIVFATGGGRPVEVGTVVVTRPAKSGELGDVFDSYRLVRSHDGDLIEAGVAATYRGEGIVAWN